jgi:hypothetical protein
LTGRYGPDHRALRRAMLPGAWGTPCARCGRLMLYGEALDLDHRDDGAGYLGMSHRSCNSAAGARKGNRRRRDTTRAGRERVRMKTTVAVLAVEVAEDRNRTAIVAAKLVEGEDHPVIELVGHLDGTRSALAETIEVVESLPVRAVVIDPHGSASWLREPLAKALRGTRAEVVEPSSVDLVVAHQEFGQHLEDRRLKVVRHPALDDAARAVQQRRLGGAFAPDRRVGDVAPIVAAELALWGLLRLPRRAPVFVA